MLHREALTLALLLSLTHAIPQVSVPVGTAPSHTEVTLTGIALSPTARPEQPLTVHLEHSVTALQEPPTITTSEESSLETTSFYHIPHVESSVSALTDGNGPLQSATDSSKAKAHAESSVSGIESTNLATIALPYAHTEVGVSITQLAPGPTETSDGNGGGAVSTGAENAAPNPPASTGDSGILNQIASEINNEPQPPAATATATATSKAAAATATGSGGGNNNPSNAMATVSGLLVSRPGNEKSSSGADIQGQTAAPSAGQAQTTGAPAVTLGTNALTLTPGLSTVLGTGSATTLVELTTNSGGQTIVIVGSSTSTLVTMASTAKSAPVSGITGTNGGTQSTGSAGAAATTSKKSGAASGFQWGSRAWLVTFAGVLGLLIML